MALLPGAVYKWEFSTSKVGGYSSQFRCSYAKSMVVPCYENRFLTEQLVKLHIYSVKHLETSCLLPSVSQRLLMLYLPGNKMGVIGTKCYIQNPGSMAAQCACQVCMLSVEFKKRSWFTTSSHLQTGTSETYQRDLVKRAPMVVDKLPFPSRKN